MNKLLALAALAGCLVVPAAEARPARGGDCSLRIAVTNVRVAKGRVHVDVCQESEFLKKCAVEAEVPAVQGTTIIVVRGLAPGRYAVQGTLDENANGRVDRGLFGIPKEGVGFSNDAPIRLAPPKWQDAVIDVNGDANITFKLRYF